MGSCRHSRIKNYTLACAIVAAGLGPHSPANAEPPEKLCQRAEPSRDWVVACDSSSPAISGHARVFGTNGPQNIRLLDAPSDVTFDASFNRGNDTITFPANASSYAIQISGSVAVITRPNQRYAIPVGPSGIKLIFADGGRTLRLDVAERAFKLGNQALSTSPQHIL